MLTHAVTEPSLLAFKRFGLAPDPRGGDWVKKPKPRPATFTELGSRIKSNCLVTLDVLQEAIFNHFGFLLEVAVLLAVGYLLSVLSPLAPEGLVKTALTFASGYFHLMAISVIMGRVLSRFSGSPPFSWIIKASRQIGKKMLGPWILCQGMRRFQFMYASMGQVTHVLSFMPEPRSVWPIIQPRGADLQIGEKVAIWPGILEWSQSR